MTIFFNNIKRLIRKKSNLIFLVLIPVASILLAMAMSTTGNSLPRVGVVDNDNTKYSQELIKSLEGKCSIMAVKEDEVQTKLLSSAVEYVFVIDKGFTDGILNGKDVKLNSYKLQESNGAASIKYALDSYVSVSKTIAGAANGDDGKFYTGLDVYKNGNVKSVEKGYDDTKDKIDKTSTVIGFLVMSMMFLASLSAITILDDKKKKTFYRVAAAPVTTKGFMFQNVLSYYAIMAVQVLLIIAIMSGIFHFYLGPNPVNLFILLLVFSAVCVSLGVAVTSISRDTRQASTLMTLIVTPVCMLGGCWWPREIMPGWLLKVGDFVPTTWIMKSANNVLYGSSLSSVSSELIIMGLFALALFLLGSWRKADVAA